jgi:hypothetical protein
MPKPFALALAALALLSVAAPAIAEPELPARVCPGVDLVAFERRFPEQVRRYAFDRALLEPFMRLWLSGRRPALPVAPERVTVYALPKGPYLVGYQNGGCVIAFLSVERAQLWKWLRPHFGWSV